MSAKTGTVKAYAALTFKPDALKEWDMPLRKVDEENDIEIKILWSGICHSDLHTVNGDWGEYKEPVVVGHEIIGEVTWVGSKVSHLKVGDIAGVGPQGSSCHDCRRCSQHREQHCEKRVFTYNDKTADGQTMYGGYAQYYHGDSQFAVKIPAGLPLAEAAPLLCAGVTVFTPLRNAHLAEGSRVGVLGIGGLGHLAIQFAAKMGHEVTAISTSPNKKEEAAKLGAKNFLISKDPEAMKAAENTLDYILVTCSGKLNWQDYLSLLCMGGKLVFVGLPGNNIDLPIGAIVPREITVAGSIIGSPSDISEMLAFAAKHQVLPMIEKIKLSQVNEGLKRMEDNLVRYRCVMEIEH